MKKLIKSIKFYTPHVLLAVLVSLLVYILIKPDIHTQVLEIESLMLPHSSEPYYVLSEGITYKGCIDASVGEKVIFMYKTSPLNSKPFDYTPHEEYQCK